MVNTNTIDTIVKNKIESLIKHYIGSAQKEKGQSIGIFCMTEQKADFLFQRLAQYVKDNNVRHFDIDNNQRSILLQNKSIIRCVNASNVRTFRNFCFDNLSKEQMDAINELYRNDKGAI